MNGIELDFMILFRVFVIRITNDFALQKLMHMIHILSTSYSYIQVLQLCHLLNELKYSLLISAFF